MRGFRERYCAAQRAVARPKVHPGSSRARDSQALPGRPMKGDAARLAKMAFGQDPFPEITNPEQKMVARERLGRRERYATPEYKARSKVWNSRRYAKPEYKARKLARAKASNVTPEYKARARARYANPENKARVAAGKLKWYAKPENKERAKARKKALRATPEYKAREKAWRATKEYRLRSNELSRVRRAKNKAGRSAPLATITQGDV